MPRALVDRRPAPERRPRAAARPKPERMVRPERRPRVYAGFAALTARHPSERTAREIAEFAAAARLRVLTEEADARAAVERAYADSLPDLAACKSPGKNPTDITSRTGTRQ